MTELKTKREKWVETEMRAVTAICIEMMRSFFFNHTHCNGRFSFPSGVVWKSHPTAGPYRVKGTFPENPNLHLKPLETKESFHSSAPSEIAIL